MPDRYRGTPGKVFPANEPLTESEFRLLFGLGVDRAMRGFGLDRLALWIGACTKTLTNSARARGTIRADLALNAINADPAAFSALFARLGWEPVPVVHAAAPNAATLAQLADLIAEYANAIADRDRSHVETLRIVERIRPLLPALRALVYQADRIAVS